MRRIVAKLYADPAELIRKYIECRNQNDVQGIRAFFAPEMVVHFPPSAPVKQYKGADEFTQSIIDFRVAFCDWHEEIHELWRSADKVVCRVTESGIHQGEYLGIDATGKRVEFLSTTVFRVDNHQIFEQWYMFDAVSILQQLGVNEDYLEQKLFPGRYSGGDVMETKRHEP